MRDPLWRLKTLPWAILLQNALLTVLLATLLDMLLSLSLQGLIEVFPASRGLLDAGSLGWLLLSWLAAGGVGALAVILMERVFSQVVLDTATLWAMVPCLALALFVKGVLPIPQLLVGFSYIQVVGVVLGVFSQGRSHWRY